MDGSRQTLTAMDAAVRRAQAAGRPARLTVAACPGTGSGLLADALHAYSRQPGAVESDVVFTRDQISALRNGTADVALMCGSGDVEGLEITDCCPPVTTWSAVLPSPPPNSSRSMPSRPRSHPPLPVGMHSHGCVAGRRTLPRDGPR